MLRLSQAAEMVRGPNGRSEGVVVRSGHNDPLAAMTGLEPATSALTGQCSNQLSYIVVLDLGFEPRLTGA